jgi:hypothetical protein
MPASHAATHAVSSELAIQIASMVTNILGVMSSLLSIVWTTPT